MKVSDVWPFLVFRNWYVQVIVTCLYIYTEGKTYTPRRTTRLRICVKETSYMLQQGVTEAGTRACTICVTCLLHVRDALRTVPTNTEVFLCGL